MAARHDAASPLSRAPLGQLSPNVRHQAVTHDKTYSGSPLKRNCTAALDSENGFTYLKRRRLSSRAQSPLVAEGEDDKMPIAEFVDFRFAAAENNDELPPLVSSQAPANQDSLSPQLWDRSSSTERHSFSSLIDYDPSSQPAKQPLVLSQSRSQPAAAVRGASRAEILRLRLRVAMYKVQTDQIHTPFDYLREQTSEGFIKESSRAVREAVEQLRTEARDRLATQQASRTHCTKEDDLVALGPAAGAPIVEERDIQQHLATPRSRVSRMVAAELTSSAVKSNVAEGLLGLKHAL